MHALRITDLIEAISRPDACLVGVLFLMQQLSTTLLKADEIVQPIILTVAIQSGSKNLTPDKISTKLVE